ncbi:MAG: thioredoxin family protein [Saprospiraceae bacterium]
MALTPSKMLPLGTRAPEFTLLNTISGKFNALSELKSDRATVLMFICNHCPYVIHLNEGMVALANQYMSKGVSFIAISSNDVSDVPEDGPENMKISALNNHYPFPYLYDETQAVALQYDAACTPDFYIFDGSMRLVYRGRWDNSRPGSGKAVTGADVASALDAVLSGAQVSAVQYPSMGCNIKWKK